MASLTPGKRYRVTFEGTALMSGGIRLDEGGMVPGSAVRRATKFEALPDLAPVWEPGDVVVVRYELNSIPYTYVRGANGWPGEHAAPKTDETISRLWRAGQVTPVLQSGGVPFDTDRLPKTPSERRATEFNRRLYPPAARRSIRNPYRDEDF